MEKEIRVYHKKSGGAIKSCTYVTEFGCYLQYKELHEYLRSNPNFKFQIYPNKKLPPERFEASYYLRNVLRAVEPKEGSVDFLNRIIRNGGFSEYVRKLEAICG